MLSCPSCDRRLERKDIRSEGFFCPGCKEKLRVKALCPYEQELAVVAASVVAFLVPSLLGAHGFSRLLAALVLFLPICGVLGALRAVFSPYQLIRDSASPGHIGEPVGNILRITAPREPPAGTQR